MRVIFRYLSTAGFTMMTATTLPLDNFNHTIAKNKVWLPVLFLHFTHRFEKIGNLAEVFLTGYLLELRVHLSMLIVLTFRSCF